MSDSKSRSRAVVLVSAGLLLLLAAALGARLLGRGRRPGPRPPAVRLARHAGQAPAAAVPAPATAPLSGLKVPCWGCTPESDGWALRFQTDLDLLAPLGNGTANAALWLKDFSREVGAREAEAEAALKRRVTAPGGQKVLPPQDPLLAEAEPWCDQATMRFYPDVYPVEGFATRIPNLALALTFARSWAARAAASPDALGAAEDYRRAIRLGRLLRQEDATVISDLVGLACIRAGAQGLYDLAVARGDTSQALVASLVLGEHAPQRLRTAQMITKVSVEPDARPWPFGLGLGLGESKLEDVIGVASGSSDRRFRAEATLQLGIVSLSGKRAQRKRAHLVLERLASDKDPFLASVARWCLDHPEMGALLDPAA